MIIFWLCCLLIIPSCYSFDSKKSLKMYAAATIPPCGIWSSWSCMCCGGCSTQRCTRTCQNPVGCDRKICEGSASKIGSMPCTSPSQTCKFPLSVCCSGQEAYVNKKIKARWCKSKI